jgi:hypothetical protein
VGDDARLDLVARRVRPHAQVGPVLDAQDLCVGQLLERVLTLVRVDVGVGGAVHEQRWRRDARQAEVADLRELLLIVFQAVVTPRDGRGHLHHEVALRLVVPDVFRERVRLLLGEVALLGGHHADDGLRRVLHHLLQHPVPDRAGQQAVLDAVDAVPELVVHGERSQRDECRDPVGMLGRQPVRRRSAAGPAHEREGADARP